MAEQHFDTPQPGWQMIEPGIYRDSENQWHFFAAQFLIAKGIEPTRRNCEQIEMALRAEFSKHYPDAPISTTYPDA